MKRFITAALITLMFCGFKAIAGEVFECRQMVAKETTKGVQLKVKSKDDNGKSFLIDEKGNQLTGGQAADHVRGK